MSPRRASTLIAVALGCVIGLGTVAPVPAAAACVGAQMFLDEQQPLDATTEPSVPEVRRGRSVTVSGEWFRNGCDDSEQTGPGCAGPRAAEPTETPMTDVELVLVQGDAEWTLATADAGSKAERYAIEWSARLPADAEPGPATLRAGTAELPVELTD